MADTIEQIMDLLNGQNGRDFVDQNTPMTAELFKFLQDAPAGSRGSISTESEGPGAGIYPAATLPESFGQVGSLMPEALARGELNEKSLKDYTDALQIFNSGGKGEKIAGVLAGLAGAGGYIADRTSSDSRRRRQSSADLGPALESLFSIPGGMRAKREGRLKSEFDRIDFERELGGESIGARTTAKQGDNSTNLAFRQLEQKSSGMRANARTGGAAKEPSQDDKNFALGNAAFKAYRQLNPELTGGGLLTGFRDADPVHYSWMAKGNKYLEEYQSAEEYHTEAYGDISDSVDKQYQKIWEETNMSGDQEAIEALEYRIAQEKKRRMMAQYQTSDEDTNKLILDNAGIDLSIPETDPPPPPPTTFDQVSGAVVKGTDALAGAIGGDYGGVSDIIGEKYAGVIENFAGMASQARGIPRKAMQGLIDKRGTRDAAQRQGEARANVDALGNEARGFIPDVFNTPSLSDLSGIDPLMDSQAVPEGAAQESPATSAPVSKGGEAIPHGDRVLAYAETAIKFWAEHQDEWGRAGNDDDTRGAIEEKVTEKVEAEMKAKYGLSPKQIELLLAENEGLDFPSMYLEAIGAK